MPRRDYGYDRFTEFFAMWGLNIQCALLCQLRTSLLSVAVCLASRTRERYFCLLRRDPARTNVGLTTTCQQSQLLVASC